MWIEMIERLLPQATFGPPATDAAIQECERTLGRPLPADLVALLRESDGVAGEYGHGLVWPVRHIASENVTMRTSPDHTAYNMPFDPLLFFGDAGNGDLFAFVLPEWRHDVFAWDHEDDSRTWVAPDLATYLTWWLDGTLKL